MKKKLYLQMFAEDSGAGAGTGEGAAGAAETGADGKEKGGEGDNKPVAKYTDEDLDRIINRKFAEMEKKKQKEVDEAKKLAKMDAQQKAEYERDELQKQLDDYKRKDSLAEMTKTARKMLSDAGVNVPDELLSIMVTTDAEQTKAAVDGFAKLYKDAVEAAVKERLKGNPPSRGTGGGVAPMTKEQIMAIKDPELRQQKMLEHKNLFNF